MVYRRLQKQFVHTPIKMIYCSHRAFTDKQRLAQALKTTQKRPHGKTRKDKELHKQKHSNAEKDRKKSLNTPHGH